ncbi:MAG: UDP-N-acetylglucosamine 1-carboxyvinyltransferase [Acidobacteriota bacterium]
MDRFRIDGPQRLTGRVRASGAKNAALPALAATLLTDQEVTLSNLPRVRDLQTLRRLLAHLGVEGTDLGPAGETVMFAARGAASLDDAPYDMVKTMRASVLVLGPLLARRGHARVSLPGGCAIGVRPIDQHLLGLEAMGATVRLENGYVNAEAARLAAARFRFASPTVTGTENLLMAATLASGTSRLENCAREPEIADLARLLTAMGARIAGAGTEVIEVEGVDTLHGASHRVIADRIEGGTYLVGAAMTSGDVTLEGADPEHLAALLEKLAECGCTVDAGDAGIRVQRHGGLKPRDVVTAPHPGFPTDLQAQYMALMTQAEGIATLHETVFENRFQHAPELVRMGADIRVEGGTARVYGPARLSGATVMATDLRASASLVLAGLVANGTTLVDRIYHLDRGYEAMETKLADLGARVERLGDVSVTAGVTEA